MYPVGLEIRERRCLVVGGGQVAERKVQGLLQAGARVEVVSPAVSDRLRDLAISGRISWMEKPFSDNDLQGVFLVFAATDDPEVQAAVVRAATTAGLLLNVADSPADCTFHVPAVVRRGNLTLAVSTDGKSPAIAAMIREQLAEQYGEEYGLFLELIATLRQKILAEPAAGQQTPAARKILFKNLLHNDIVTWIRDGRWDLVEDHVRTVLGPDVTYDCSALVERSG